MNMKGLMVLGLFASVVSVSAFDIPRGTHDIDDLDNARAEAAEKKKPVVFLFSKVALAPT